MKKFAKTKTKFIEGDVIAYKSNLSDRFLITSIVGTLYFLKLIDRRRDIKAHCHISDVEHYCVLIKRKQKTRW